MNRGEKVLSQLRMIVEACSRMQLNASPDLAEASARVYLLEQCENIVDRIAAIQAILRRARDEQLRDERLGDEKAASEKGGDDVRIG